MGSYKIGWKSSAAKELKKLPKNIILEIIEAVAQLSDEPYPKGIKKISGSEHTYRLRIRNYRIIYSIEGNTFIIEIIKVGHRKDVYR